MQPNRLVDWLIRELDDRQWSHRELARRAGISHTSVSQVLSEVRQPTWEFCAQVARALSVPVDNVFILAGLRSAPLRPVDEEDEALAILRSLSAAVRRTVLTMLRALATDQPTPIAAVQDSAARYTTDEPWIRELIEELRQVPEDWREEATRQIRFVVRMANRPAARIIGEEGENETERHTEGT